MFTLFKKKELTMEQKLASDIYRDLPYLSFGKEEYLLQDIILLMVTLKLKGFFKE